MKIICPESSCRKENDVFAEECVRCGTQLQSYVQLLNYPAHLFNEGLVKARNGELEQARDLFAAVVYWCPKDLEARNALAMACLALHDLLEARRQWEIVLAQSPADTLALRGLSQLETQFRPTASSSSGQPAPGTASVLQIDKHGRKTFFILKKKKQS
jgi:tetratricopeptide (TPR) repeat protein